MFLFFAVAGDSSDQEGVEADGSFAAGVFRCGLTDVLVVDFEGSFGDVDVWIVTVEGDALGLVRTPEVQSGLRVGSDP